MNIILFELNDAVCTMSPGIDNRLTLLETGQRDVPAGVPFWIVESAELPIDEPTDAWELDLAALGEQAGIGGTYKVKSEDAEQ